MRASGSKRAREELTPCYRYFSYLECKNEATTGFCRFSHDHTDGRQRELFLGELRGLSKSIYEMLKKELKEKRWTANMVSDTEFRAAIIQFLGTMEAEAESSRPTAPTRGGGARGGSRGYRGGPPRGGPPRGGTRRVFRGRGGPRGRGGRFPTNPPAGWNYHSSSSSSSDYTPQAYAATEGGSQDAGTNAGERFEVVE